MSRLYHLALAVVASVLIPTGDVFSQEVYWTTGGSIRKANLDGSFEEVLFARALTHPLGVAYSESDQKMYWTDPGFPRICRSNSDGTALEVLFTKQDGLGNLRGIAIDVTGQYMYWSNNGSLYRSRLDVLQPEPIAQGSLINAIAFDDVGQKVYWTDFNRSKVQRANPDGSSMEVVYNQSGSYPWGIALDVAGGKIYWTSKGTKKIQRANLDGSDVADLIAGLTAPRGLAVMNGKLYWMDGEYDVQIFQCNLDGSDVVLLIDPTKNIEWFAVNSLDTLFWTFDGYEDSAIFRRSPAFAVEERVLENRVFSPEGIAIDVQRGLVYWTDGGLQRIERGSVNGSSAQVIVHDVYARGGLDIDVGAGKIYWTAGITGGVATNISRSNLDGTQIEALLAGEPIVRTPESLVLDCPNATMYWTTTQSLGEIRSAPLDGGEAEVLVSGNQPVGSITQDRETGLLYWFVAPTGNGPTSVMRCDPSNCTPENMFTMSTMNTIESGLTIDPVRQKYYWAQVGVNGILESNFDGSDQKFLCVLSTSPKRFVIDGRHAGDVDNDAAVTLRDWGRFQNCYHSAIESGDAPECNFFDCDPVDSKIDSNDATLLTSLLEGPT